MKYYSTLRPLFIGCTPKPEGNDRIINYDEPKFIDSIGRVAFGYFETDKKIEYSNFDLIPEMQVWTVTYRVMKNGELKYKIRKDNLDFLPEPKTRGVKEISFLSETEANKFIEQLKKEKCKKESTLVELT